MPLTDRLSREERHELDHREGVIEGALRSYRTAGTNLRAIRDARLYRQEYGTFEAYCNERWGMDRTRAYQLIAASEVAADVCRPMVDTQLPEPSSERVARPLTKLDSVEERRRVWFGAVSAAEGSPTAELVDQLVSKALAGMPLEDQLKIVHASEEEAFERTRPIVADQQRRRGERGYTRLMQARKQLFKAGYGEESALIRTIDRAIDLAGEFAPEPASAAS